MDSFHLAQNLLKNLQNKTPITIVLTGPWIKTIFCNVVTFINNTHFQCPSSIFNFLNSVKDFNINKEVLLFHLFLVFRIRFIELYKINPRLNLAEAEPRNDFVDRSRGKNRHSLAKPRPQHRLATDTTY